MTRGEAPWQFVVYVGRWPWKNCSSHMLIPPVHHAILTSYTLATLIMIDQLHLGFLLPILLMFFQYKAL